MTRLLASFAATVAAVALLGGCATSPPSKAADARLIPPPSEAQRTYLGLSTNISDFRLEDIRCEILVIDCFDMYCHICQTGAQHVNELYKLAQERGLGARIKFIGLGVGDTPLEVATYKNKFNVPFPLFPDRRSVNAKQFGELRLPNLLVLWNQNGQLEVIHRWPGVLLDPAKLLSQIQTDLTHASLRRWTDGAQAAQPTCEKQSSACLETRPSRGTGVNSAP